MAFKGRRTQESYNIHGIQRSKNPGKLQYTWHSNNRPVVFSRLGYFFITDSLCNIATNSNIIPGYRTDHSCVVLNISFTKSKRGKGYFKINNSLLIDRQYRHSIKKAKNDTMVFNRKANANVIWELIKGSIRNYKMCTKEKNTMLRKKRRFNSRNIHFRANNRH